MSLLHSSSHEPAVKKNKVFGTKAKVQNRHTKNLLLLNIQNVTSCSCIDSPRAGSLVRSTHASREKPREFDQSVYTLAGYVK